jgi:membrane-bound ClpP family serine protease
MSAFFGASVSPTQFLALALLLGFGVVALAKIYGLFFMRWKTPFRIGKVMNVSRAEVIEWSAGKGYVMADGEMWRATSSDALVPGDNVSVDAVNGLLLRVTKKPA